MEEGCIQENNDLACNSLEELNTFSRNAVVRLRKCKLVMQGLFAAEFKIILKQKRRGGGGVKLFDLSKYCKWATIIT